MVGSDVVRVERIKETDCVGVNARWGLAEICGIEHTNKATDKYYSTEGPLDKGELRWDTINQSDEHRRYTRD